MAPCYLYAICIMIASNIDLSIPTSPLYWFAHPPQQVEIFQNEDVLLNCNVNQTTLSGIDYYVEWSKDSDKLLDSRSSGKVTRGDTSYTRLGNGDDGVYLLHIENAQVEAGGAYHCKIINTPMPTPPVLTNTLYVLTMPSESEAVNVTIREPLIVDESHGIRAGTHVRLQCNAPHIGGYSFRIKWQKCVQNTCQYVGSFHDHIGHDTHESHYEFNTTADDNGAIFNCTYFSPAFPDFQLHNSLDPLNIVFEPQVNLQVASNEFFEGDNVLLYAQAKGNPSNMTYHWACSPPQQISTNGSRVTILNLDQGTITVTCTVLNAEGVTVAQTTLTVQPKPIAPTSATPSQYHTDEQKESTQYTDVQKTTPLLVQKTEIPISQKANKFNSATLIALIVLAIVLLLFMIISIYLLSIKSCRKNSNSDQMQVLFHRDSQGMIHLHGIAIEPSNSTNHYAEMPRHNGAMSSNGTTEEGGNHHAVANTISVASPPKVPARNQSLKTHSHSTASDCSELKCSKQ